MSCPWLVLIVVLALELVVAIPPALLAEPEVGH
jgi:hypothetical protein